MQTDIGVLLSDSNIISVCYNLTFWRLLITLGKVLSKIKYNLTSTYTHSWKIQCIFSDVKNIISLYRKQLDSLNVWRDMKVRPDMARGLLCGIAQSIV